MYSDMFKFFILLSFIALPMVASAQNPPTLDGKAPQLKDTCYVQGTVRSIEKRLATQYDSRPSIFNNVYLRLTMDVNDVRIHEHYGDREASECSRFAQAGTFTFKLCSTRRPKGGDIVTGIAGYPAEGQEDGCLFDINVTGSILNK